MHERKAMMFEEADAFITIPGGGPTAGGMPASSRLKQRQQQPPARPLGSGACFPAFWGSLSCFQPPRARHLSPVPAPPPPCAPATFSPSFSLPSFHPGPRLRHAGRNAGGDHLAAAGLPRQAGGGAQRGRLLRQAAAVPGPCLGRGGQLPRSCHAGVDHRQQAAASRGTSAAASAVPAPCCR
jgi:hypothetical protein